MAEECFSSSGMAPVVLLAVEGCLRWVGVREEAEGHPAEGAAEAEEASYHREEGVGEVGPGLQNLARAEEAGGHRGGRGRGEDLQEQQLPASAGREL